MLPSRQRGSWPANVSALIARIKPRHVRAYLDKRGQTANARANREKAC